jgi:hypothetical protein
MKAAIMEEIEANDLEIYQFPDCDSDEVKNTKMIYKNKKNFFVQIFNFVPKTTLREALTIPDNTK